MNNSYWLNTAPPFNAPAPEVPRTAECVILGAGIMGCALAYWLARAGKTPLVLERNAHPAGGATGRNGGLHVAGPGGEPYHRWQNRAEARAIMQLTVRNRELLEEILARENIQANYKRVGFMHLAQAHEVAELQALAHALNADGFSAHWLERAEAEAKLGTRMGEQYVGAMLKPEDGQFHSARYTFGVAEAALKLGARFVFNTPVQSVDAGANGQWLLRTPRGNCVAQNVIITLNAWAGEIFPELEQKIVPTRGHIILTAPVNFALTPWEANDYWDYGRQLETGQILLGGRRNIRPDLDKGQAPAPGENVPPIEPSVVAALSEIAPQLFPELKDVPIAHAWTGTMAFTADWQPLAGRWPGRAGLWVLAGFSGHGMPFSLVLPQAIAAQLTGTVGPEIPEAFNPKRFLEA
jgi:glycine/D-amino acid oxidase-like deaminating enzyme